MIQHLPMLRSLSVHCKHLAHIARHLLSPLLASVTQMVGREVDVNAEDDVLRQKPHEPKGRGVSEQRTPVRGEDAVPRGDGDTDDAVGRADTERDGRA